MAKEIDIHAALSNDFVLTKLGLQDQADIDSITLAALKTERDRIKQWFTDRQQYITDNALDPNIYMPQPPWVTICNRIKQYLLNIDMSNASRLKQLRLSCAYFAGFSLLTGLSSAGSECFEDIKVESDFDTNVLGPRDYEALAFRFADFRYKMSPRYHVNFPTALGEIGGNFYEQQVLNEDIHAIQALLKDMYDSHMLAAIQSQIDQAGTLKVLEIGGGSGGLAYALKSIFPELDYTICDLPECLTLAALYLDFNMKGQISLLPNYKINEYVAANPTVGLVISLQTMGLVTSDIVTHYGNIIDSLIGNKGVFYEISSDNSAATLSTGVTGTDAKAIFDPMFAAKTDRDLIGFRGNATIYANQQAVLDSISNSLYPVTDPIPHILLDNPSWMEGDIVDPPLRHSEWGTT